MLHFHMMVLLSVDFGFTTTEDSSRRTIFFFLDKWRSNQRFNLLVMMLHRKPPRLISISALIGENDWRKGPKIKRKFAQKIQRMVNLQSISNDNIVT